MYLIVSVFWTPTALDSAFLLVSPVGHPEFKNIVAFMAIYMIVRIVLFDMFFQ